MPCHRQLAGVFLGLLVVLGGAAPAVAAVPPWLPRYDLDIHLDVPHHRACVRQRVTWTNRHACPTGELVFNAHAHYKIPDTDIGYLAKMLEVLRMAPSQVFDFEGHALEVHRASVVRRSSSVAKDDTPGTTANGQRPTANGLPFSYRDDNPTALVVTLPGPVGQGETVTVDLEFTLRLPQKQGRWGQWQGVTFLAQWLPVLAYYDDHGWQPTPFIPWHQPFFNEAGVYTARVTLPCDQHLACSGSVVAERDVGGGLRQVEIVAGGVRDFALLCSARYREFTGQAGPVRVRCLAFPEHEFYAREMVRIACEAIPVYSHWIGPYPYAAFTIAESYFGWNGNECGGLIMIDERVFALPHLAKGYVEYLVAHETCHQWFYNLIGTHGYCETWMDEAVVTYLTHRWLDQKCGKNNRLLVYPRGLEWLPSIHRENYRYSGLYGTLGRGEAGPCVQEMPKFGHVVNLFSLAYDRGSKVVGMLEDRLGEAAFLDFLRLLYGRYQYRILRVADFQCELEAYTGRPWDEFFRHWLYGAGMTDWAVEKVSVVRCPLSGARCPVPAATDCRPRVKGCAHRVTVLLHQKADYNEQTVLGFELDGGPGYRYRIPILPQVGLLELDDPPARVQVLPGNRVRVEVVLPGKPTQVSVDPDQVLVDPEPANNHWKRHPRWRLAPLYTVLEEADLTNDYDRWNLLAGPWVYGAPYSDPWYTRATMVGVRAGAYRTQHFSGGAYAAYRTDFRDVVAGVDGLWDHTPWSHTQFGFNAERSLATAWDDAPPHGDRAMIFGRYVFHYGTSLYLPPMHYAEVFGAFQDNILPFPERTVPGAQRYDRTAVAGVHYRLDFLTPYWDPEGGFRLDVTYSGGVADLARREGFQQLNGQFSFVKCLPEGLGWLSQTRVAARLYGAAALPDQIEYFPLGGSSLFRGFDLAERQGSLAWVASLEWRVPVAQGLTWDCCDHVVRLRNIYAALFYDVGNAYVRDQALGPAAHALGAGLRLDVAWFGIVERTTLRFDLAKAVNAGTPVQLWFGIQHPF
jgi:hypothetical protein